MNASIHRVFRRGVATLAAVGIVLFGVVPTMAHATEPVNIPDAALRACINEKLGQAPGDDITTGQAATLDQLYCSEKGIVDLTGLDVFTNLEYVDLPGNMIADLTPLATLHSLVGLYLDDNNITDISVLAGLTHIEELWLQGNNISDIGALEHLVPALQDLYLDENHIADLRPLQGHTLPAGHLLAPDQTVDLGDIFVNEPVLNPVFGADGNSVALSDLYDAADNTFTPDQLGVGSVTWTDGADFSGTLTFNVVEAPAYVNIPDANLRACINDDLGQAPDAQITVAQAEATTHLFCYGRGIVDLTGLDAFINLEIAFLGANDISDLTPLSDLTALELLTIADNAITDVGPLATLPNLLTLDLYDNAVTDLTPLGSLTSLEWLYVDMNDITDLGALAPLTELLYFSASDNEIFDITVVENWTQLEGLEIAGNHISDISALAGIASQLWVLDVSDNHIADLSPLGGHTPEEWFRATNQTVDLGEVFVDVAVANPVTWVDGTAVELNEALYDAASNGFTPIDLGPGTLTWGTLEDPMGPAAFAFDPGVFSGTLTYTAVAAPVVPVDPVDPAPTPVTPTEPGLAVTGQQSLVAVSMTGALLLLLGGAVLFGSRRRARLLRQ